MTGKTNILRMQTIDLDKILIDDVVNYEGLSKHELEIMKLVKKLKREYKDKGVIFHSSD